MKSIAFIPARGGSQGIPRKNIKPLAGKPLLGWTIDAARVARAVDHIVVSTDDEEIAGYARPLWRVRRPLPKRPFCTPWMNGKKEVKIFRVVLRFYNAPRRS